MNKTCQEDSGKGMAIPFPDISILVKTDKTRGNKQTIIITVFFGVLSQLLALHASFFYPIKLTIIKFIVLSFINSVNSPH